MAKLIDADKLPKFPTMLRKMWSGGEVQQWIDENITNAPTIEADSGEAVACGFVNKKTG